MNDCKNCIHYSLDIREDPCYYCLSGYVQFSCFKPKPKEVKKEKPKKADKKLYLPEDTPLPWSS